MEKNHSKTEGTKETVLLAQLIEILAQNAIMLLGVLPDRQGRQRPPDLNGAEMMIEMLSVLQKKTKGNLSKEEEKIIATTLYQLQAAFADVASKSGEFEKARKASDAIESEEEEALEEEKPAPQSFPAPQTPPSSIKPPEIQPSIQQTTENKVKFTKKYT